MTRILRQIEYIRKDGERPSDAMLTLETERIREISQH